MRVCVRESVRVYSAKERESVQERGEKRSGVLRTREEMERTQKTTAGALEARERGAAVHIDEKATTHTHTHTQGSKNKTLRHLGFPGDPSTQY